MNRFHNKYHRHNHHSNPTDNEPDSSHDPLASKDDPFQGEFHIQGELSAISGQLGDLTIHNNLTVQGQTRLQGNVFVESPITYILEHLTIVPKSTTQDFYFKIDSQFTDFPLMEVYLKGACAFMLTSAANLGLGTCTPREKLDVNGNVVCLNLSAENTSLSNLTVSAGSHFNTITADNTSQIGYLEIGYVKDNETYIKTISGNRDLFVYSGDNLNVKFHPNSDNFFPGKLGIGMEPIEKLTLSGQMGFRQNGLVLLDNSYNNTLRIITNRAGDDDQHLFTFTYDGRFVVGDIFHDYVYPCLGGGWNKPASHKINAIDLSGAGQCLSLTSIVPDTASSKNGSSIRLFRANGDLVNPTAIKNNEVIGDIRAFGFTGQVACYGDRNAAMMFFASNDYSENLQGAYITFETTDSTDSSNTCKERVRIDHNGNVGINTNSAMGPSSTTSWRNTTRPSWKLTVRDDTDSMQPAAVIIAGQNTPTMAQIVGGEGVTEQTALMLSDRGTGDANVNHITFTHGTNDAQIARVSSLNRGAEGVNGGSLLFSTTYNTTIGAPIIPFERARINFSGDMGIGIKTPFSRLHVHDDDKSVLQASGILRDVVTVSTLNNTNGILLSSANLQSRVYNNNTDLDLHISTCTTGGSIKFNTDNEAFAAIITDTGVLGINVDESIKAGITNLATTAVKLAVNGDVLLFNSTGNDALSAGSRLFFNQSISSANTDPMFIHRVNTNLFSASPNKSELRFNIGDDVCIPAAAGAPTKYANDLDADIFSVGNYTSTGGNAPEGGILPGPGSAGVWNRWVDIGPCSTIIHTNLSTMGDATFDGDVTINGALSVINPGLAPTKFKGDIYVDGNIFATGNITGFCGCEPPAFTTGKGVSVPAGWPWGPPHPPTSAPPVVIPSDSRLKLGTANITSSLEKVMQINGVTFTWDETKQTKYKGKDVGVIAQEIEKILPEIVHEQSTGYKGVQYEKIIPLLIECIKELKKEIDDLKLLK